MSLCLYALIPAFLPLAKAPLVVTFCNSPHLCLHVALNLFNMIKSTTFHCFLQLQEQEVARSRVRTVGGCESDRMLCFARNSFVVTALWAGALSWCMIQLPEHHFSGRSAHSDVEALQTSPSNVEERNQHGLDIGFHLSCSLWSGR